jgi:phage-related protein
VRTIEFYKCANRSPIDDFLEQLSDKQVSKVFWTMQVVKELPVVGGQYLKKLSNTNGLWEIRIQHAGNIFRLLGFFKGYEHFVIVHAFAKKTQKTPGQDIVLAEQRKKEYENRNSNG